MPHNLLNIFFKIKKKQKKSRKLTKHVNLDIYVTSQIFCSGHFACGVFFIPRSSLPAISSKLHMFYYLYLWGYFITAYCYRKNTFFSFSNPETWYGHAKLLFQDWLLFISFLILFFFLTSLNLTLFSTFMMVLFIKPHLLMCKVFFKILQVILLFQNNNLRWRRQDV